MSLTTIAPEVIDGFAPDALAELANDAQRQVEIRAKSTAEAALVAGRALAAAKEQIAHGQWEAWLQENWRFHPSLARRYMQISKRYGCSVLENRSVNALLTEMSAVSDEAEPAAKTKQPELYDAPIEVTAREPEPARQPSVSVKKPAKPKPVKSFVLEEQLDHDRETILERAAEYFEHEETERFLTLLRNLIKQIQSEMLEAKR